MASGTTRPNGAQWVFFAYTGKRHTLRLGPIGEKAREEVQRRLETLIAVRAAGLAPDVEIRQWLAALDRSTHAFLARVGLVEARTDHTIDELFAWHSQMLADAGTSPSTLKLFDRARDNCRDHWGGATRIETLTPGDGDGLQRWMRTRGKSYGGPLADTTTSRRLAMVRQVFAAAVARGLIAANPLGHIKRRGEANPERDEYIPWDDVLRLLAVEPTAEFRLLLALVRICGLRCPSEVTPLPWRAFDRTLNLFTVQAPKTRRHKPQRDIPIFAELAPYLDALGEPRSILVFPHFQVSAAAITDRLEGLCRRCKMVMWPKPFVNMRASAERDMAKLLPYDEAVAYLGHSPETALRHYNRVAKELRAKAEGRALRLPDLTWEVKRAAKRS